MTAEIASEAQKVADGHAQLTNSVATLAVNLGELQSTSPTSGLPPAPGIDRFDALSSQVIGLDAEIRAKKGRTSQLFQEVDSRLRELQTATATSSGLPADPMAHGNEAWSAYLGKGGGGHGPAGAPTAPETFRMHTPPPAHGGFPAYPTYVKVMQGISAARKRTRPAHVVEEREFGETEVLKAARPRRTSCARGSTRPRTSLSKLRSLLSCVLEGSPLLGVGQPAASNGLRVAAAKELPRSRAWRLSAVRSPHGAEQT